MLHIHNPIEFQRKFSPASSVYIKLVANLLLHRENLIRADVGHYRCVRIRRFVNIFILVVLELNQNHQIGCASGNDCKEKRHVDREKVIGRKFSFEMNRLQREHVDQIRKFIFLGFIAKLSQVQATFVNLKRIKCHDTRNFNGIFAHLDPCHVAAEADKADFENIRQKPHN